MHTRAKSIAGLVCWALWAATIFLYIPAASSTEVQRPEIWLTPFAPYTSPDGRRGAPDYFDLFKPDAPWSFTAAHVKVFKIYRDQVVQMSDDALREIFRGLAERHIALAMESNVLVKTSVCRPGIDQDKPITPVVERLKRLGADLQYLALNEPLIGGHVTNGPNDCHATIQAVANDVAESLKPLWAIYPDLKVGDIEPIGRLPGDTRDWPAELKQWMDAYRVAAGRPLTFMHADTVWGRSWPEDLHRLAKIVQEAGILFGVIYNGDFSELSDRGWADDTAYYAKQVEDVQGIHPDQVIFQSWDRWPQNSLPDTDSTTITGIIRDYLRGRTKLTLGASNHLLLTDETGRPIQNADIDLEERNSGPESPLIPQSIAGEVPPGVTSALFAMRVNAECQCSRGPVNLAIGGFDYGELSERTKYDEAIFKWDLKQWSSEQPGTERMSSIEDKPILNVSAQAGQTIVLNGPHFPVHAGKQFKAHFDWRVDSQSNGIGYAAIIFLGSDGIERRRTLHRFRTTWNRIETITSGADGHIVLPTEYRTLVANKKLSAYFHGDSNDRPVRLRLP